MSKDNLPSAYYAEATPSGVRVTFDCGDTFHYLTGPSAIAVIDDLSVHYMKWRGLRAKRGKEMAVLDRCVTGRRS